jgi:glycosyltransferase involved in cell wall biosynthesis
VIDATVVTVCLNAADTLEATIRSVSAQRGVLLEHILVDGASSDGTMDIVARHAGHFAHVVSEPDEGLYHAMNKGLALASGEVTGFLNADDVFAGPDALATLLAARRAAGAQAVYSDVLQVDRHGRASRLIRGSTFRPSRLRRGLMPPHPTFYALTSLLRGAGGFRTAFAQAADFDLIVRLFGTPGFQAAYAPGIAARMRLGGLSTSGVAATRHATADLLRSCAANGLDASMFSLWSRYPLKLREVVEGHMMRLKGGNA